MHNRALRLLLVEDNAADARYLAELLRESGRPFQLTHSATLSETLEQLSHVPATDVSTGAADASLAARFDIVLLDLNLSDSDGLESLVAVRNQVRHVPVLVLTGLDEERVGVQAVQAGAQDYLVKGEVTTALLMRAIHYAIERERIETSLRSSEERYRELFENANDAVYIIDLEGNFTSVNQAAVRLSGYTREELLRMNIAQVIPQDALPRSAVIRDRKLGGEAVETRYTLDFITRSNERRTLEVSSRLIYQSGKAVGVQGIARDVTEQRALEDRLRQSQKMEAVGRTAGGVAHEFNNLLTIITGHTELVLEGLPAESSAREELIEIGRAAERAARITRELLTVSRHRVASPRLLNINEIVSRMQVLLQPVLGDEIRLRAQLAPVDVNVRADPALIEQVILNLAFNARDAMPHGGELRIETAITACESAPERARNHRRGDYAVLRVSDNGIGMSEETKSRIFEPFFTTKEIGKGTGLGLAVVFGVVSQSGGHIEVESKSGRGSTFTIYLPLARERAAPPPQPAGVLGAGEGSETVLLVEDEESVRRVLNRVLTSKGYRVLEAAHGREALQQMEQARGAIDLLITDVAMPEMRGPELAERVRARFPHTRVLYISGYAEERTAVESAGDGYLQKPFTPDVLTAKVRQMLDQPRTFALPGAK